MMILHTCKRPEIRKNKNGIATDKKLEGVGDEI